MQHHALRPGKENVSNVLISGIDRLVVGKKAALLLKAPGGIG